MNVEEFISVVLVAVTQFLVIDIDPLLCFMLPSKTSTPVPSELFSGLVFVCSSLVLSAYRVRCRRKRVTLAEQVGSRGYAQLDETRRRSLVKYLQTFGLHCIFTFLQALDSQPR